MTNIVSKQTLDNSFISQLVSESSELIEETEDISELLTLWKEYNEGLKGITTINDRIKTKIKNYLKERQWDRYMDKNSKISITISKVKREDVDKEQLKLMLTEAQLAQVTKVSVSERLIFVTPERRKELSKLVRRKPK